MTTLGCTAMLDFSRSQLPAGGRDAADVSVDVTADVGDVSADRAADVAAAWEGGACAGACPGDTACVRGACRCPEGLRGCGVVPRCRACCDHTDCDDHTDCTVDVCTAAGACEHRGCAR